MNASNLMAVSTADGISAGAGAPKGRSGSAGNRAQATSGKNSFSDAFGALQKGINASAEKSKTRNAPVNEAKTKLPQSENTLSQDTQDVAAKAPEMTGTRQTRNSGAKNSPADESAASSAAVAALAASVNTDAALVESDVNEGLDAALTEILERYELTAEQLGDTKLQTAVQNLLLQMPGEGVKSRNLLLALEGQPLAQENAATDLSAILQGAEAAKDSNMEALCLAALDTNTVLTSGNTSALTTEAVPAAVLLAEGQAENMQAAVLKAQTESALPTGRSAAELVGENLSTDDVPINPLTVLAQRTMRHDASQGDAAGQGTQQEQDAQPARMTAVPFEMSARTSETAPQPAQPIAAQTMMSAPLQEVDSPAPVQEAQHPQPDYEIPRQIVEQARLLRTLSDTQMVIRLRPEHLGELTLRVAVGADGAVQASFHSDNAHVRNVIENSLVQLRQELNNQGLKVDRVGVYTGLADGQMPQGQGQEAWQQSSSHRGETQYYARGDADDYLDEVEGLAPVTAEVMSGNIATDGVDYRV